eukprot:1615463-Alexandrium_andersonii.AAC.1
MAPAARLRAPPPRLSTRGPLGPSVRPGFPLPARPAPALAVGRRLIPGKAGAGPGPGTPGPLQLPRARARRSSRWITG